MGKCLAHMNFSVWEENAFLGHPNDHTIETYAIYWPTTDAMTKAQSKIF